MTAAKPPYDEVDLSSMAFWSQTADEREKSFALLRQQRPISWHPPAEGGIVADPDDPGFWALVRHADIVAVSKNVEVFSSSAANGGVIFETIPEMILDDVSSILSMDPPRHTQIRALVSQVFSPRRIKKIEDQIRNQAKTIVDDLAPLGEADFVHHVSQRLPLWTISEMLGVPPEQRQAVVEAVDNTVAWADPEVLAGREPLDLILEAFGTLHSICQDLIEARRAKPEDDLMSALISAEVDGQRLTDEDIRSYFCLLAVAGNDTTRNTTSHAMKALCDFPDQRKLLVADFDKYIPTAIEEFLRWGTAVMTFRRTATADTEIAGQPIAAGDKVVMFYSSGNRDEAVFTDPYRFDITRHPNPHVAFGGGGPHFCLGNHVARMQMRHLFNELLHRLPDLQVGEPEYLAGNFMHAVKRMPCTFTPQR